MSATPCAITLFDTSWQCDTHGTKGRHPERIVLCPRVLDALLAVAKAAIEPKVETEDGGTEEIAVCRLCGNWRYVGAPDDGLSHFTECPILKLDAAHPEWRSW